MSNSQTPSQPNSAPSNAAQPSNAGQSNQGTSKGGPGMRKDEPASTQGRTGGMKDEGGSCATSSSSKTEGCN